MHACWHQFTISPADFETDIKAIAKAGFNSVEIVWSKVRPYVEQHSVDAAKQLLNSHGLTAVALTGADGAIFPPEPEDLKKLDHELDMRFSLCQELACPILVVTPTPVPSSFGPEMMKAAAARLKETSRRAAQANVTLAVEFLRGVRGIENLASALQLVRMVDEPNCGVLFDTFHFYRGSSQVWDIDDVQPGEIVWVHVNDVAKDLRETWGDEDRVMPGDGVIPLVDILRRVRSRGYDGALSLELFNPMYYEMDPNEAAAIGKAKLDHLIEQL